MKAVTPDELEGLGAQVILANAYHLYLRPGLETISEMGGRVAADDLACCGRRLYPAGKSEDPFHRMAERLIDAPPDTPGLDGLEAGVRAALEIATRYSDKRHAFGRPIRIYQGVNFMVADAITRLDAARALVYMAARAVDEQAPNSRRLVSQAKKFATDMAWEVANKAMQIMGGIGYTEVYPIEKMVRDIRLSQIWTGTNEIMNLLIQHEYYQEVLQADTDLDNLERGARAENVENEKCYTDEDMWRVHNA